VAGDPDEEEHMDVVDVTERLMAEFEDRLELNVISGVVNRCRLELAATTPDLRAEDVERTARQQLLELVGVPPQRSAGLPAAM
jgi:hypothetical protein